MQKNAHNATKFVRNGIVVPSKRNLWAKKPFVIKVEEMKKKLSYIITAAVCVLLTLLLLLSRSTFSQTNLVTIYRDLCDSLFGPGIIMLSLGLLVLMSNGGAFNMLRFAVIKLFDLFKRDMTKVKYRTFYDYNEAQKDKKHDFWFLIIVGAVFVVLSVVFLILYELQV